MCQGIINFTTSWNIEIKFSLAIRFDGERFMVLTSERASKKRFKYLSSGEEISSLVKNISHRIVKFYRQFVASY